MSNKSGLDMLEEILKRLDNIEKRQNILDANIKKILNSVNLSELINNAAGTKLDGFARAVGHHKPRVETAVLVEKSKIEPVESAKDGFKNFQFDITDAAKSTNDSSKRHLPPIKQKNIMVQGKMIANIDGKNAPLASISVKIFNSKDELVKETKTNRAGHWMSQLTPGSYVALFDGELNGKKLVSQNRNFIVPETLPIGKDYVEVT